MSKIEWTERSWNPIVGCSKVSEGCKNCYAIRMAWRLSHNPITARKYFGTVHKTPAGNLNWTDNLNLLADVALLPMQVKKPTLWFVNSMSDLFHEKLHDETIQSLFEIMRVCPQHTFQVVTKRAERAALFMAKYYPDPLPNVWIGFSVENQEWASVRLAWFSVFKAAVKFVSMEPLLGPVDLQPFLFKPKHDGSPADLEPLGLIDWVIVGGESGPDARPMHPEWAKSLRDQCTAADVPFFFKQWGEWAPLGLVKGIKGKDFGEFLRGKFIPKSISCPVHFKYTPADQHQHMLKIGKKAAGRLLDGVEWNEMPANFLTEKTSKA